MTRTLLAMMLALFTVSASAAVDINKADQAQLEQVKGIGPALSQRILDERKNGAFKDWADLIRRIGGVGPGNAARLSAGGLTVDGSAYAATLPAGGSSRAGAAAPAETAKAGRRAPAASAAAVRP